MIHPNRSQTTAAVAAHYDELDLFYREVWGEHVHHGFWATGRESRLAAVEALVDLMATRLDLAPGQALCDIGCGYGATAVRLAERHGVHVTGVTVSGVQATIAAAKSPSHGSIAVLHRDWLSNGFPDRQFDRAYAIESSEHMPNKRRFFAEAYRTLRPGGRLAVCAWLARDRPARGKPATCSSPSAAKVACPAWATRATTGVSRLQPGSPWPSARISAPASAAPGTSAPAGSPASSSANLVTYVSCLTHARPIAFSS